MGIFDILADSAADFFIELARSIWEKIKKILVKILNFLKNIVAFFKDPSRLMMLRQDSNKIAIAIKENLDNGEYQVVNCLFDKSTNELVDYEENAMGISAENLDEQTAQHFGDKAMIVLQ